MLKTLIGMVAEMLSALWRQWKLYPITLFMVAISLALYGLVWATWAIEWLPYGFAETVRFSAESFGWFRDLLPTAGICGQIEGRSFQEIMEAYGAVGLTKLWDGEVWRLLVSAFHHAFWLHIVGNLLVIWYLGIILEEELSKLGYVIFFLVSATLSIACQALALDPCVGLSGTGYAMFGMLIVLRLREPRVAMQIPRSLVNLGVFSLLVCIPITHFGFLPVANIAHFSGFIYGLLAGWVAIAAPRVWPKGVFAAAHLLLVPLAFATVDPFWSEDYIQAKMAIQADEAEDISERIAILERLVARAPEKEGYREVLDANQDRLAAETDDQQQRIDLLTELMTRHPDDIRYRLRLVAALYSNEQRDEAWQMALKGWDYSESQSQQVLADQITTLWRLRSTWEDREHAESLMDAVFGEQAESVKERFDLAWVSVESASMWQREREEAEIEQKRLAAERKSGPPVDADAPGSAALGQRA